MLSFSEFKNEFIKGCTDSLSAITHCLSDNDIVIDEHPVTKAQHGNLTGLVFRAGDSVCAPTLYVEDFYDLYKRGNSVDDLYVAAISSILCSLDNAPDLSEESLTEPDRLHVRLLNRSENTDYLKNVPHTDLGCGLALIAEVLSGEFRAVITNDLLECYEMDEEELLETALINSSVNDPPALFELTELLNEGRGNCINILESGRLRAGSLYLLSNADCFWGAAVLFYPGLMARLHELMGGSFYIIPSSVHELLLLPVSEGDPQQLAAMIREANRTVVSKDEFLLDDLLICEACQLRRISYRGFIPESGRIPC